jgi:hypothetical protein
MDDEQPHQHQRRSRNIGRFGQNCGAMDSRWEIARGGESQSSGICYSQGIGCPYTPTATKKGAMNNTTYTTLKFTHSNYLHTVLKQLCGNIGVAPPKSGLGVTPFMEAVFRYA